jgi:hypothetical protein
MIMPNTDSNNKSIFIMTGVVFLAMAILLAFNLTHVFSNPKVEKYLPFNDVKGTAIEHKGGLYTLNFDQQNSVIEYLNLSIPVGKEALDSHQGPLNFTKLIIYRFNKPDLVITPIQYEGNNLIFSSPEWNHNGYLKDVSYGHLKNLLATTYDP